MNALEKAEQLKQELNSLRPLDAEAEARIMQKFRLDWNYHSNNLEGNSLTYGETKALILFGITAQGKPLKDHFEITGHNEAINWILEVIKDETPLTEKFIRELHTLLLKESSYKEAQTTEGKPTRRKIEVGKYKTQPNHVVTVTGETFYFAMPEETPAKMHELIEWFRNEKEKPNVNPIILAALFHYRFIRIHPFDDGNGRTARILMNFILMQFGYPPVIIKTEDKENYFAVLRLADADQLEPFIEYIAQNLVRSLEIMIKGAKGGNIEEPDDLNKELTLLEKRLKNAEKNIETKRNSEIKKNKWLLIERLNDSIAPLLFNYYTKSKEFDRFYTACTFQIKLDNLVLDGQSIDDSIDKIKNHLYDDSEMLELRYSYQNFKLINLDKYKLNFNYSSQILVLFSEVNDYLIMGWNGESVGNVDNFIIYKNYSQSLSDQEASQVIDYEISKHKKHIQRAIEYYESLG